MRKAIVEASSVLEGIGPSFTELRRYLGEISTDDDRDGEFDEMWSMEDRPGTPSGVRHFLTSDSPEGKNTLSDIIAMALGKKLSFVSSNADTTEETSRLSSGDIEFLKDAFVSRDNSPETVDRVLDTIPACSMAVLGQNMGDWESSDERNLSLPGDPVESRVVNGWLVHNSDYADDIYSEGFLIGNPIGYLAYGKKGEAWDDRYGFAYRIQDAPAPGERTSNPGLKYTWTGAGASIVFRGSGNVVDHYGDAEKQVIFDIHEPTGCFLVKFDGEPGGLPGDYDTAGWSVYGKNPGRPLVSGRYYKECLRWIAENGDAYRNQLKEWK